ncbi:antirestriction protein [Lelliottia nimipressuralis]|uniref:Antirestriction protein n=2 Tax=Lelliottia nimipressuralis TaxID=69220 RepID=A0ABD4KEV5_9ENTR|nr:antirestriction protein [Lelliottia nimipressuralis]
MMNWLSQYSDYGGGCWHYFFIPEGAEDKIAPHTHARLKATGYNSPDFEGIYKMCVPVNYFEADICADAAGIISPLMILNIISWKGSEMGEKYTHTCQRLVERQNALKYYISITKHPEVNSIYRAIN